MLYTINYKDLLAFKKDANKSVKDYDATINKIFNQISAIKSNVLIDNLVVITFDETVKFVDPLFFILLFDLHSEYKFTLVVDIRYMEAKSQHYIQRILTQYSDLDKFQTYSPYAKKDNNDIYITIDIIAKTDNEERERQFKRFLEQDSNLIHLFSNVVHKKSLINDTQYEYSLLPILKLRNYKLKEIDTTIHEDSLEPYEKRINFYNKLSLLKAQHNIEQYRTDLHNKIEELLIAVGLNNRGLSNSFRDIFFELIDNIRKHTSEQTNAHISFRKDLTSNLYELIISDNSNKGFLNTYKDTLEKEKSRLEKSGVNKNLLQNYVDVIKDIDDKNHKKVLTGLFQIEKKHPKNSKDDIHIHQIPRIAMHFGLPLLVKLLEKLSKKESIATPELKLFLHNEEQYFEITYSFKNGKFKLGVNNNSSHRKKGTYIIVTFPTDVVIVESNNLNTLININFHNNDYKLFLDKREIIEKQINNFSFYLDKHIEEDLDMSSKNTYICENKCAFIKYMGHSTFSEFLRNIYLYAYKHDIEDIVVFNVPLYGSKDDSENIEHIKLLETIMYSNDEIQYEKSLNILFYSDREPEAILIGGRNQKEYCYLNQLLPNWYGASNQNSICPNKSEPLDKLLSSKLFVHLDKKAYMLPFELFEISDIDRRDGPEVDRVSILGNMLEKYLNEFAKIDDIHIDTGTGYHINRFMEFKKVFEDSRWVRRLAFRLAMQFPKKPEDKKYYLYGTDKYTNMLISLCYTFLNLTFDRFGYKLFNIHDPSDYKLLRQKIKTLKEKSTHEIYLVSSVVVNAQKDIELINDFKIKAIPAIQLNIEGKQHINVNSLVSIKNYGNVEKITNDGYCIVCSGHRKVPLLEFAKNDPFFIKDTFFDTIQRKNINSYSDKTNIHVRWFDSLNFGHVARGNNHFLYYINTIKFFNQNRPEIEKFLSLDAAKNINYNQEENIVLITSSHDTNNNFVALVNQEIFNNEAIVLSFNKSRGEANFHDLKSYESFDWENTRVFFVDDSIASSHTLKYFYQMLRSVPGIMNTPNVGLDGVIIMIDRISSYDETILCSYLRDSGQITKSNQEMQQEKLKAIHAFTTFEIKPIKSEVEECFLCKRNEKYIEFAKKSALDLTTFQMVKRAYKLRKIEYRVIQPAKEKTLVTRFKNYLKAMATTYIYQELANKEYDEFTEFTKVHQKFSDKIYEDIICDKKERFEKYDKRELKKIIEFQSEVALIKACSSPRLSYYYNIRRWIITTVSDKLYKQLIDQTSTPIPFSKIKNFTLEYRLKECVEKLCNTNKLDKGDIEFLDFYKNMTNLHLINIYFATLGYFEDSRILDKQYIDFFYKITQSKDVRNFTGDSLLHTYPFAVKFTISDNLEKAIYFENNLNFVLNNNNIKGNGNIKKYSYLNALKLENILYWKNHIKEEYHIDISRTVKELQQEEVLDKKIDIIKNIFDSMFKNSKVYLFVSPYATITPESYLLYLKNSKENLINILDSHTGIDNYDKNMIEIVQKVFCGAVDVEDNVEGSVHLSKVNEKDVIDKISDTWANDYDDKYCVVRLTSIDENIIKDYSKKNKVGNNHDKHIEITDNKPVWFRPIGCLVIEKDSMNYQYHMDVSRMILSIKENIVTYIEKEFSYGVIQEAINKEVIKKELIERYRDMITKINHSIYEYINIGGSIRTFLLAEHTTDDYKSYLKDIKHYSWGLELLTKLHELKNIKSEKNDINKLFENNNRRGKSETAFKEDLDRFINVCGKFSTKLCSNCNKTTLIINKESETCNISVDYDSLKIVIFELIFNALKRMSNEKTPSITITLKENQIILSNTLTDRKDSEGNNHDDNFNKIEKNTNNSRMGVGSIKEALSECGYQVNASYNDQRMSVTIKEKINDE